MEGWRLHGLAVGGRAAPPGHRGESEVRTISAPTSDFGFISSSGLHERHDGPVFESFLLQTSRYWITPPARPRSDGGIVRPRAFAVLRSMTSSNFVGCSTEERIVNTSPLRRRSPPSGSPSP